MLADEFVLDNMGPLLDAVRDCNVTLRWLMLQRHSQPKISSIITEVLLYHYYYFENLLVCKNTQFLRLEDQLLRNLPVLMMGKIFIVLIIFCDFSGIY